MNLEWLCPTKSCFGSPVRTHKNTHVMTQYLDIMHTLIYHCRLQRNVLNLSIMVLYVRKYEKKNAFWWIMMTYLLSAIVTTWNCPDPDPHPTSSDWNSIFKWYIQYVSFFSSHSLFPPSPTILPTPFYSPRPSHPLEAPLWPKEVLEPVVVTEGSPLVLLCNPPPGLPPPFTFWMNSGEHQIHTNLHCVYFSVSICSLFYLCVLLIF